jgi:hypothetical protein
MIATQEATVFATGHRMSRNRHREPVCRITLLGDHVIGRFASRMLDHQMEFHRMGKRILKATPGARPRRIDDTVDGFRVFTDDYGQPVVVITLVGWHSIHRFAYNMLGWQCEFSVMGRKILKSHRRAAGRANWKAIWTMYHGAHEKPMTFYWGTDD